MELALIVECIPTLTVEGERLCVLVEISATASASLLETLRLCMAQQPDSHPTP
jgi:hypothetical protein